MIVITTRNFTDGTEECLEIPFVDALFYDEVEVNDYPDGRGFRDQVRGGTEMVRVTLRRALGTSL